MLISPGGPQQGPLKAQFKLSKPHLTASQANLNLWRAAQQHEHTANNLVEPARAWGSVVDGEEKEK